MSDLTLEKIDEESLSVVPLHQHPEYMKQCCELVNEEWPRSETARMLSLQSSCDMMPTCLVLLSSNKKVIGHCKLTPIPSIKHSCFVESVVISKSLRGKGLGTFLMQAIEEYCRLVLNLKSIHLSTKGQEYFYKKLGYDECEPITIYGSFSPIQVVKNNTKKSFTEVSQNGETMNGKVVPPIPPPLNTKDLPILSKSSKTYMMKFILL